MPDPSLTKRQYELLCYLRKHEDDELPPSLSDCGKALGIQTRSGALKLMRGLEERGYIKRMPGRARAIEIIRRK